MGRSLDEQESNQDLRQVKEAELGSDVDHWKVVFVDNCGCHCSLMMDSAVVQ